MIVPTKALAENHARKINICHVQEATLSYMGIRDSFNGNSKTLNFGSGTELLWEKHNLEVSVGSERMGRYSEIRQVDRSRRTGDCLFPFIACWKVFPTFDGERNVFIRRVEDYLMWEGVEGGMSIRS